jgi:hypothetical protein
MGASEIRINSNSGDDTNTYKRKGDLKDFKEREKALLKKRRRISAKYEQHIKPCYYTNRETKASEKLFDFISRKNSDVK